MALNLYSNHARAKQKCNPATLNAQIYNDLQMMTMRKKYGNRDSIEQAFWSLRTEPRFISHQPDLYSLMDPPRGTGHFATAREYRFQGRPDPTR
jgi:hypothetical protein